MRGVPGMYPQSYSGREVGRIPDCDLDRLIVMANDLANLANAKQQPPGTPVLK